MTGLLVALGAAVGAPLRYVAGHYLDRELPRGTALVNLLGSFLLGLLLGLPLGENTWALLGIGFCGGLTTYSAFAVRTVELGWSRGTPYALVTIAGSITLCGVGLAIGVAAQA